MIFDPHEIVPTEYLIRELEALAEALDYGLQHSLQQYWMSGDEEEPMRQSLQHGYRQMGALNLGIARDWLAAENVDSERHLGSLLLGGDGGDH